MVAQMIDQARIVRCSEQRGEAALTDRNSNFCFPRIGLRGRDAERGQ